jgi:hypothetical protein
MYVGLKSYHGHITSKDLARLIVQRAVYPPSIGKV